MQRKLKNSHGYSVVVDKFNFDEYGYFREFGGSSLDRKKQTLFKRKASPKRLRKMKLLHSQKLQ